MGERLIATNIDEHLMSPKAPRAVFFAAATFVLPARDAAADPPPEARAAVAQADRLIVAMDATSEHVRRLLREARARKSRRGVTCLDEALSRVDVALRVGREEARATREAARAEDLAEAQQHLARVVRLREASRAAASKGEMCAAGPEFQPYVEGTTVRLIIEPSVPGS